MLFAVASCDDVHFKVLGAWFFKTINLKSIKKASYVLYIVFIPGIFFWGGESPPQKTYNSPQTPAKLCALNFFWLGQWITHMSQKLSFNEQ